MPGSAPLLLAVDLGGTRCKAAVFPEAGGPLRRLDVETGSDPLATVRALAGRLAREAGGRIVAAGLSVAAVVDPATGAVSTSTNLDEDALAHLAAGLGAPCRADNDGHCMALGELHHGAGRGVADLLCVSLGTGVGGGAIASGRLLRGARGAALEIGHIPLDPGPDAPTCGCGARGCLEAHVGALALRRRWGCPPEALADRARSGDPTALAAWREVGRWLGRGLATAANLLDPERIVVGGGLCGAWDLFAGATRRELEAGAYARRLGGSPELVRSPLSEAVGLMGALELARSLRRGG